MSSLILAAALVSQCANGSCAAPARYTYAQPRYTFHAAQYIPAPVKSWHALSSHPGYLGYGALNARGEVVTEFHCRLGTSAVIAGPAPSEPCGVSGCGCGCGVSKVCGCADVAEVGK